MKDYHKDLNAANKGLRRMARRLASLQGWKEQALFLDQHIFNLNREIDQRDRVLKTMSLKMECMTDILMDYIKGINPDISDIDAMEMIAAGIADKLQKKDQIGN